MSFEFIADRPVLDFLPTLAARGTDNDEKLLLEQDLADWILQSGIVDHVPPIDAADLQHAKMLREAMFRMVDALIRRRTAAATDLAAVNAAAAASPPTLRLDRSKLHRTGDLAAVLAVLARDCLDLHDSPDRALLHWCADRTCTRPFIDRSRGQRRRWCGMKGCGDRAKAAAYRQRQQKSRSTGTKTRRSPTRSTG